MSIVGSEQWMYSAGREFYEFPLEQSLRFEDGDSAYLSRTPASAGNRKTFTYSTWVKRGNLGLKTFISAGTGDTARTLLFFDGSDKIVFGNNTGSGYFGTQTNAVFRDVSAWYHIVFSIDTTQATTADRVKIYVNGVQQTDTSAWNSGYIAQNTDTYINNTSPQVIGSNPLYGVRDFYDGFKAEVNLIDGTAYDASSFGEFKSGIWTPRDTSGLSYGTNGFRLNFADTVTASGFNTVTWTGNNTNGGNSVNGVGFSPDLVWAKCRSVAYSPLLYDSIRGTGATAELKPDGTEAEGGSSSSERGYLNSFDSDGFSSVVGSNGDNLYFNQSGQTYVGWCWDAGSGSAASNTDGSITSTVKANTDYGFSVVTYTGTGANATVGHGLGVTPDMYIVKNRDQAGDWCVYHKDMNANPEQYYMLLNTTNAAIDNNTIWNDTAPTSTTFSIGSYLYGNNVKYVAYCFAEKTGFSSISSYTGDGTTDGSKTITTGFKPAFVMMKNASTGSTNWLMFDNTRDTKPTIELELNANNSNAEANNGRDVTFTDTGFTVAGNNNINGSGDTYIYMAFKDTRDAAFWRDVSGQGNDWQHNNLTFSDVVPDGTNNFATLNPLYSSISASYPTPALSEGNLAASTSSGSNWKTVPSTMYMSTGKWYAEIRVTYTDFPDSFIGFVSSEFNGQNYTPSNTAFGYQFHPSLGIRHNSTQLSAQTFTQGDIIGLALNLDDNELKFYKNGSLLYTATSVAAGSWSVSLTLIYTKTLYANFGQDSTFAGAVAAGGNADENGYGDFAYAPPSGYLSLCSANLPTGAIDTLADETPEDYFNTVLYTGTGASNSITGINFQPSLTWVKIRNLAYSHNLYDAVRGANKRLRPNSTGAEASVTDQLMSFDSDGFTLGADSGEEVNSSGNSFVSWNWKAGGTGVSNTDGSITSTVSVGATSQQNWFSVATYTGTGSLGTVGHGLNTAPSLVIIKNRSGSPVPNWVIGNSASGWTGQLYFDTSAFSTNSGSFNNTAPTSSVVTINTDSTVNYNTGTYVMYSFANAEGLCKVGSYTGNGSADGTFVYTGFRPSYVLCRRYDAAAGWHIFDNERANPFNVIDQRLEADNSDAEGTTSGLGIDLLSNGFKFRGSFDNINGSGNSCLYLAIAEQPFKYANAR